jgi:dihydropteroate synthase
MRHLPISDSNATLSRKMTENRVLWKTRRGVLDLTRSGVIMGIVNTTPDSFSDGGRFFDPNAATEHALRLVAEGADIIDIGGESTRPGAAEVAEEEELARVIPVIRHLRAASPVLISIDTSKAEVARAAIEAGADIINDVTALAGDARMPGVAAMTGAGVVLMHMQGNPRTMQIAPSYDDVVRDVREFLRQRFEAAVASGIDPMCVALDPGIGFGKSPDHNRLLVRDGGRIAVHGRPVVLGVSRKSFLGSLADASTQPDRLWAGVALTSFGREMGVHVFRVHDVKPHHEALRMTEAILNDRGTA